MYKKVIEIQIFYRKAILIITDNGKANALAPAMYFVSNGKEKQLSGEKV